MGLQRRRLIERLVNSGSSLSEARKEATRRKYADRQRKLTKLPDYSKFKAP